jgi:lipopolysaccharide export system protein LptA
MFVCTPFFVGIGFAKTVITSDEIEVRVRKSGSIVIANGNSKVVSDTNTITACKMFYDKSRSIIFAVGNVILFSKIGNENFKIYGDFMEYNVDNQKGKICGDYAIIEHHRCHFASPVILCAKEIYVDIKAHILSARKKDKSRPIIKVNNYELEEFYEADEIIFYNYDDKKIAMNGSVVVKIKVKCNDFKNRKII